jgi:prolipoprotein diacylglyceryltransferase
MPLAVIELDFDPLVHLGDLEVRAQTIALAMVFLAGLLAWARIGSRIPQPGPYVPPPMLRLDDIPFLVLGIVPGAVIGGRLDYVLVHLDYYLAHPASILDPAQGSLGLGLAVPGALVGAALIGRLVDAPTGRWMHAAALPALLVLGLGKLTGVLAAEGQGSPTDVAWATAYLGPGPWASLAPEIPSHPAQVYEGLATLLVLGAVGLAFRAGAFGRRDGAALLAGIGQWAIVRGLLVTTWRDAPVLGPFRAEQVVLAVVVGTCLGGVVRLRRAGGSGEPLRGRTTT